MTCLEKWKEMYPDSKWTERDVVKNECPSSYGIMADPKDEDGCCGCNCASCWNREVQEFEETINDDKLRIYAAAICDAFENLLDEHDITIPDLEREGNEDEARLYGLTYENLENRVVDILKKLITSE